MQPEIVTTKNHKRSERRRTMLRIREIAIRHGLPMPEKIKAPDGVGASLRDRPRAIAAGIAEAKRLAALNCRHRLPQVLHRDEPDFDAPYDITAVHPNPLERPKFFPFGKARPVRLRTRGAVAHMTINDQIEVLELALIKLRQFQHDEPELDPDTLSPERIAGELTKGDS